MNLFIKYRTTTKPGSRILIIHIIYDYDDKRPLSNKIFVVFVNKLL